jgi:hypothetical protein
MRIDSSVHGRAFTASDCDQPGCNITFRFDKGYKGVYTARENSGLPVRGVYVRISTTYNAPRCPECNEIRLLQIIRRTEHSPAGETITADPRRRERRRLAGWDDPTAGSRGWIVDTPIDPRNATTRQPYATSFRLGGLELAHPGSAREPAVLWDAPGDFVGHPNSGAELETCAVCTRPNGRNTTLGCVRWGFYIDDAEVVSFEPSTPEARCGISLELVDAVERFERQPGNRPSDLDFVGMCLSPSSWTGPARCEFTSRQDSRLIATRADARRLSSQAMLAASSGDRYMATLARRIFQISRPNMSGIADQIQLIHGALQDLRISCGTCADASCNPAGVVAYVPDDLSRLVICPRFFLLNSNDMRRTLIFEAGNIIGIDPLRGADGRRCRETPSVECQEPCGNLAGDLRRNSDAWARYIECAAFSR